MFSSDFFFSVVFFTVQKTKNDKNKKIIRVAHTRPGTAYTLANTIAKGALVSVYFNVFGSNSSFTLVTL